MPDNETVQLSERELEILKMVATGASNQQIARQLVISINTVKVHLRNVFEKLGVQSRTEATTYAIQRGWVIISDNGAEPVEAVLPSRKSFLLTNKPRPPLTYWQQLYLGGAVVLSLALLVIPLLPKQNPVEKPILPVIFVQPSTPAPPSLSNITTHRWVSQQLMPTKRAGLGLVAFEGQIYAIGGVKDTNQATRQVDIFDPIANSWSEGSNKPAATAHIVAATQGDKIYVPGGCNQDGRAVNTLDIYLPKEDEWHKGAALPAARCGYGLVVFQDQLYLFGGWDGQKFVDTVLAYSIKKDKWEVRPSTLPKAMGYMGAAVLNETIYVVGGYNGETEFNETYIFDPATNKWQQKASMLEKRGGLGLVGVANSLYAIGGGWDQAVASSEKYDPASDTWSAFETPFTGSWRNLGLTVLDTKLYAVGGWNGTEGKFMDSVVSYQFLFELFLPVSRSGDNK